MDGPSSRFPSMSVSYGTNIVPGTSFSSTPRQTPRELLGSVSTPPMISIDPPRSAKQGYEWVWFPAGYWAEREIIEAPPKESIKAFRWRKRSGKSASGSPNLSSHASNPFSDRMEASSEHSTSGRLLTRTAASSESGGSFFPLNRMPDAPLPSPYLTEEAHVQSLQWPSIDAAVRRSSTSESSVLKSGAALSPSPLHFSHAESEIESESVSPATVRGNPSTGASTPATNKELLIPTATPSSESPPKKLFKWRMLSQNRYRPKRSQNSSNEKLGADDPHLRTSRPPGVTASPLRLTSNISDKSRKPLKVFPKKLLKKARWPRKVSNSSGVSTSSSLQTVSVKSNSNSPPTPDSERGETVATGNANAWASEYPGNEAIRVQTPSIEQVPRSFFQDLSPLASSRRPLSRQEGQPNLKKSNLSRSFTPGRDSSSSSIPRAHASSTIKRNGHQNDNEGGDFRGNNNNSKLQVSRNDGHTSSPRKPRKDRAEKEWWEVAVPTSYAEIDQRTFKFDLPEHLPTSPMCPTNKRHKSGGTGVCVYHGRAKSRKNASSASNGELPNGEHGSDEEADGKRDAYSDEGEESDVWK